MFCSKCGKEINNDDVFCPSCGTRIKEEPLTNVDKAIELSENEITKRNKSTLVWLTILLVVGFLLFLLGFLLLGLSIWTIIFLIMWFIAVVRTYSSFKRLPVTQKDADEHDEKVRAKYAPKPAPEVQIFGDISKVNSSSKYGLWTTKQKGFKKFFVIFAFIAGLGFGIFGGLLPIVGVGGFASVPDGIYVQDQKLSGQEGITAYKFENGVFYYTADYTYGESTVWSQARTYQYKAGRITYKYTINWVGEGKQVVEGTMWVTDFGNKLSGNFFGLGGATYSRE